MKRTSKRWSQSEVCQLKNKGFVPERTESAINNKKVRLGLKKKREPRPKWKEEDLEKLKSFKQKGLSAKLIHSMGLLSHSVNAIQKKMCRMGLAKRNKVLKFPLSVREKFKKFLMENWEGKTPEDLTEMWSRENARYPANKRKTISYLTKLEIKIPYGEVQSIKKLRMKIEKIRNSSGSSSETMERIRLARMAVMKRRIEKNRDIWTGMPANCCLLDEEESTVHLGTNLVSDGCHS